MITDNKDTPIDPLELRMRDIQQDIREMRYTIRDEMFSLFKDTKRIMDGMITVIECMNKKMNRLMNGKKEDV